MNQTKAPVSRIRELQQSNALREASERATYVDPIVAPVLKVISRIAIVCALFGLTASSNASADSNGSLSITAVSTSTPTPLSAMTVTVSGLTSGTSITVTFHDPRVSHQPPMTVSEHPMSVNGSSIVISVPINFKYNGTFSHGSVSLTVTQGDETSPAKKLTIAPLPNDTSYGTKPGQITEGFFDLQAMVLGQQINEMQAASIEYGVNTTTDQATLQKELVATLKARAEVARIIAKPSSVVLGPKLSNGQRLRFGQQSLAMMDQFYGPYLLDIDSNDSTDTASTAPRDSRRAQAVSAVQMQGVLKLLKTANGFTGLINGILTSDVGSFWNRVNGVSSIVSGSTDVLEQLEYLEKTGNVVSVGGFAGSLSAAITIGNIGMSFAQVGADVLFLAMENVVNKEAYAGQYEQNAENLTADCKVLRDASLDALVPKAVVDLISPLLPNSVLVPMHQAAVMFNLADPDAAAQTGFSNLTLSPPNAPLGTGLGIAIGQAKSSDAGDIGAFILADDQTVEDLVAPDGDFQMYVPAGMPDADYTSVTFAIKDPLSSGTQDLSSETVDLSGLTAGSTVTLQDLGGTTPTTTTTEPTSTNDWYIHWNCGGSQGCMIEENSGNTGSYLIGSQTDCDQVLAGGIDADNFSPPATVWCDQNSDPNETSPS
jgi:hypothetical protein